MLLDVTCIASWLCLGSMEVRGVSVAFGPTPGMPWLFQPASLSRCEGHRCLRSSGTPRPKSLSSLRGYRVDPLVLAQCPTWALTLTGDWIKSGAEDGFWWCMKVYGSLRVWRVWCVWCVWCDWCVLTRTLLWQYDAVWICAGLYSMAVDRALDMKVWRFALICKYQKQKTSPKHLETTLQARVFPISFGLPLLVWTAAPNPHVDTWHVTWCYLHCFMTVFG